MTSRIFLWFKDRTARKTEREARARLAELERQTSWLASELARRGSAKRKAIEAATKAETTARLRMEIAAGYVAKLREPQHG